MREAKCNLLFTLVHVVRKPRGTCCERKEDQTMQVQEAPVVDSLSAKGGHFIDALKNLIHEGNVRKITIKQDERTIAEFPLTFGVIGAAMAPALAAIGAITALVTDCTIEVERTTA
jgi:hypothetical protein